MDLFSLPWWQQPQYLAGHRVRIFKSCWKHVIHLPQINNISWPSLMSISEKLWSLYNFLYTNVDLLFLGSNCLCWYMYIGIVVNINLKKFVIIHKITICAQYVPPLAYISSVHACIYMYIFPMYMHAYLYANTCFHNTSLCNVTIDS